MAPTLETLAAEIARLPLDQKVELAAHLSEVISAEMETAPLTDAQREELERRWQDDEANPDDVIPWEQVKAEALARFKS